MSLILLFEMGNNVQNTIMTACGFHSLAILPSVFIFVTLFVSATTATCPTSCTCNATSDAVVVNCQSQNLTSIPTSLPANTTHLYLRDNHITNLQNLKTYTASLVVLDLSWNRVRDIPMGIFKPGLSDSNLVLLDLSYNSLQSIPEHSFAYLHNLKILDLSGNRIELILTKSFNDLSNIHELRLHDNKISWTNMAFTGMTTLQVLDLSTNAVFGITVNIFEDLYNLTKLSLQRNVISTVGEDAFHSLANLATVDLSYNPFTELPRTLFDELHNLEYLQMSADSLVPTATVAAKQNYENQWFEAIIRLGKTLQDNSYFRNENGNFTQQKVGIKFIENINTITTHKAVSNTEFVTEDTSRGLIRHHAKFYDKSLTDGN
ncbi:uncharacterized protein LOC144451566 [Glandiceps talaboti]